MQEADFAQLDHFARELLGELCQSHPLGYVPELVWKPKLKVTAGQAFYTKRLIALSPSLLTNEERVRKTLTHEYAHLLAYARHGRAAANHGPLWRQAMEDLGAEPTVYHRYEVVRRKPTWVHQYRCKKCGFVFTRNRALARNRVYTHISCEGVIEYTGPVLATEPGYLS